MAIRSAPPPSPAPSKTLPRSSAAEKLLARTCAGCHGPAAKGGPGAPDLVRSLLVLDDEKGLLIAPVIREGRPDKGMPRLNVTEPQIADIVAWLHVRTYSAGHRKTYVFKDAVTGDPKKGEAYFNGAGKCKHLPLAIKRSGRTRREIRSLFAPIPLATSTQTRPGFHSYRDRDAAFRRSLFRYADRIDDFNVSLRDSAGEFHSFSRDGNSPPKVEVHDPLQAHNRLAPPILGRRHP